MSSKKFAGGFHSIFYTFKVGVRTGFLKLFSSMMRKNSCKTCALGMGGQKGGMRNELGKFPEFCKKSLQAMQSDMQGAIKDSILKKTSIEKLGSMSSRELEALGRIPYPLYATKDSKFLKRISWEDAYEKISKKMRETLPARSFFYFSGRSSNEAGFLLQIMARVFGTNHVNNCSFYCHQASGVGLGKSLGSGTATLKLDDLEKSDLFVLAGSNPSSNHPRLLTSLMHLKKRGGKVIVINPVVEPGLLKFKIPSNPFSLLFGTKIADLYIQPHIGGDLALFQGISKYILEKGAEDSDFIKDFTQDFIKYESYLKKLSWEEIEQNSGVPLSQIFEVGDYYIASENAVFSWAMGLTHHLNGVENVRGIINLALLRGMVGKENAGLLPLRGHSNVQGMGTVGVTPKLKDVVFANLTKLGFKLPSMQGYDTMSCMEAADRNEIDFAWCLGGNLYCSNPDLTFASKALNKIGMVLFMNTTLNQGHFFGRGEETIIFPVRARDEESQSTTQESMFNFLRISDGGPNRISGIKSEVEIIATLAEKLFGSSPIEWGEMQNYKNIRTLISKTIPGLEELASIDETKKEFTIPGRIYHKPIFNTPSKKAIFATSPFPSLNVEEGTLTLMTVRSEGQFNSVVYEEEDAFRNIDRRDVILLHKDDMQELGLVENQKVSVKSDTGKLYNIYVREFDVRKNNALMYYPEANFLIPRTLDPDAKTPAFKSVKIHVTAQ